MRRIGLVLFPGFQIVDMAALTVFELANAQAQQQGTRLPYRIDILSEPGGPIRSSVGAQVESRAFDNTVYDTLLVAGSMNPEPSSPRLLAFLNAAQRRTRRTASICTGAFVLAEAGLLDGRAATTHWMHARELQRRFPRVRVDDDRIFTIDGAIWTSAGMTACIDLALALVEEDLGSETASAIAKLLVVYHQRPGGQSQFSAMLELAPKSDRIQQALIYAKENLHRSLSVEQLADVANLSPRQFSRAFLAETGQSPARAIEKLRVEAARSMIEEGGHSMDRVADRSGFADPERMRRAFHRAFGQPPQAIKRTVRTQAAPGHAA